MKNKFFFSLILLLLCSLQLVIAQNNEPKKHGPEVFDEDAALKLAKAQGVMGSELTGYISYLKNDFSSKQALKKQKHIYTPYEIPVGIDVQETVIYLTPNKPMSIGCPNIGFDQYNFNGWTGSTGSVSIGTGYSNYNVTGSTIVNTAGSNVSLVNSLNYHTIMSVPASNPIYPNCIGYDSIACKAVGTQSVSQIPFISPFSFDPVSVRMNGALPFKRACKLKFISSVSATNKRLSYSFALVLHDPSATTPVHTAGEAPYFKVTIKNEATNTEIPGCTSYSFNPITSQPSDSLFNSVTSTGDPVLFRKWNYYTVDLSSLPNGTNVSINFEVGGCTNTGHYGYAYVDAECGGIGTTYANMCLGTNFATLVAPNGFNSYQWVDGSGLIAGATNDTLIINPTTVGTTYTVNMISPGGCAISQTVSIALTTVNITNFGSSSSCAGGSSGTAFVQANGSNGAYTYTWTSTSGATTGSVVSNSQTATGLPPGTYSVDVESGSCGHPSANLSVGVSPALYFSQTKTFCGNATIIPVPGGTNYQWYHGSTNTIIAAPNGTNDTLQILNAISNDIYTLVYRTSSGCKDSIRYTLSEIAGGSSYINNIQNVCPGSSNGSAVLNLSTPFSSPYNYYVTGPTAGIIISDSTTSATSVSLSSLAAGTYSYLVNDGTCIYNNTFVISPIQTNFSVTATNTVLCFPTDTAMINLNFGSGIPANCSVDPSLCIGGSPTTLFNTGPFFSNAYDTYPSPFSGYWYSGKQQFLVKIADLNAAGIFAGKISSLAFEITNLNGSPLNYPDYTIKMGCTNLSNLPIGTNNPFITGLSTVYFNANQGISTGWLTHNFSQSYVWNGTSNIIIEVCTGGLTVFPANASIELKQMNYITNMHSFSSTNGAGSCPEMNTNSIGNYMTNGANMLPNMQFGYCAAPAPASSYTVSVSSNGTITTNYANDSIKVVPTFTAPPSGNTPTVYTITAINPDGGCIATQTIAILYPSPNTTIVAVPMTTTICEGSQITLSASGGIIYNWYYQQGATSVSIASTSSVTVTPPMVGINTYSVTGKSPCFTSIPDTKVVLVNVTPKANLLVSPLQDITKCMNKNYVITTGVNSTTPGNPGTPYSYAWTTLPTNAPASGVNNASSYNVTANSTTTLVFTVNGTCANPTSDTVVVKDFVDNLSIAILDSSTTCSGTPFTLNSFVANGYLNYNYGWFISNSSSAISNSPNLSYVSPGSEGTYTITLYVNDSCGYSRAAYEVITVLPPCTVIIPNVITPNGDGVNDFFKIGNIEHHPNTAVTIFDRWGKKVFENPNYNNEWRADHLADGTFFYVIDVPDDKKYSGFITVFHDK